MQGVQINTTDDGKWHLGLVVDSNNFILMMLFGENQRVDLSSDWNHKLNCKKLAISCVRGFKDKLNCMMRTIPGIFDEL